MKKIIPEKKVVICDFCEKEIYTDQKTGDQWAGVRFKIERRATEMTDKFNAERQNEKNTNKKGNKQTWKQ